MGLPFCRRNHQSRQCDTAFRHCSGSVGAKWRRPRRGRPRASRGAGVSVACCQAARSEFQRSAAHPSHGVAPVHLWADVRVIWSLRRVADTPRPPIRILHPTCGRPVPWLDHDQDGRPRAHANHARSAFRWITSSTTSNWQSEPSCRSVTGSPNSSPSHRACDRRSTSTRSGLASVSVSGGGGLVRKTPTSRGCPSQPESPDKREAPLRRQAVGEPLERCDPLRRIFGVHHPRERGDVLIVPATNIDCPGSAASARRFCLKSAYGVQDRRRARWVIV